MRVPTRQLMAVLAFVASVETPAPASAQSGAGSIVGVVSDGTGAPVANVAVQLAGPAIMASREITTGADGSYRFPLLPPGDYELTFTAPGFETITRRARVTLGFTLTIDVPLALARRDDVTVRGVLDRYSTAIAASFDQQTLVSVPSSRQLSGLFNLTHGLTLPIVEVGGGAGITSGAINAYGRNNSPRHTIEGIVVTGLFGAGFAPDYLAMAEVSVLTAAHGAEWPTAGVHTDVITKSGSNQYRGAFYVAGEHRRLQSSNITPGQMRPNDDADARLPPAQRNQVWRNYDLNADVGGFIRQNRLWWYTSWRRQELAARLVNFPVQPYVTRWTNGSGKLTLRLTSRQHLVAYGQRGTNHQPTRLDPFGGGQLSALTAINRSVESTIDQRNHAWIWKAEWNGVLSENLMAELRAGQFARKEEWRRRSADNLYRYEDLDSLEVRGGNRNLSGDVYRNQAAGALTFFSRNRTGTHSLRTGADAQRHLARDSVDSDYPGNVLHIMRSGIPSAVVLFETPSATAAGVWSWSAYFSDTWQMNRRLTVTIGGRFDRNRLFLPAQSHLAGQPDAQFFPERPDLVTWNLITPRLATVWDIRGNGRTLAKLSFGRYFVAPNATLALNASENAAPWWRRYQWLDPNGNGVFDAGEQGRQTGLRGGERVESMDPALSLTTINEAGAWLERSVPGGITLRAGTVWRREIAPSARQNINLPFTTFTVPVQILDRGPDGVAGTDDDGPFVTAYDLPAPPGPIANEVRNVPGVGSEYLTWEIAATRQTHTRWTFGAGFTYTQNRDHAATYSGQPVRNNPYPLTPNDLINTGPGGRHEFSTWTARAYATVDGPWQLRVSPVLRHQSGQPFGRTQSTPLSYGAVTMLMEPIGTRRMDHITIADVRLERPIQLTHGRAALFVDVFNLLNANPRQNIVWASGPAFLDSLTIVPPRIARVGFTFNW